MIRNTRSQTGTGASAPVVMDINKNPFAVGLGVVVTGTVTYSVQHSFDDPHVAFTNWFEHVTLTSQTTTKDSNYAFPVTGVRVNVSAGSGTAALTVLQAG